MNSFFRNAALRYLYVCADVLLFVCVHLCVSVCTFVSKDGTKLLNISDKLNRWKEHFSQILNNKSTINPFVLNQLLLPVLKKDEETLTELSNPLFKLELIVALKTCKLGKAAGIDNLNSNITKLVMR